MNSLETLCLPENGFDGFEKPLERSFSRISSHDWGSEWTIIDSRDTAISELRILPGRALKGKTDCLASQFVISEGKGELTVDGVKFIIFADQTISLAQDSEYVAFNSGAGTLKICHVRFRRPAEEAGGGF